jgi:hypothetical protein
MKITQTCAVIVVTLSACCFICAFAGGHGHEKHDDHRHAPCLLSKQALMVTAKQRNELIAQIFNTCLKEASANETAMQGERFDEMLENSMSKFSEESSSEQNSNNKIAATTSSHDHHGHDHDKSSYNLSGAFNLTCLAEKLSLFKGLGGYFDELNEIKFRNLVNLIAEEAKGCPAAEVEAKPTTDDTYLSN